MCIGGGQKLFPVTDLPRRRLVIYAQPIHMAPKGGACLVLLILASAVFAQLPHMGPQEKAELEKVTEKLMKKCYYRGYPEPNLMQVNSVFNSSLSGSVQNRDANQSNALLSTFRHLLTSVTTGTNMKSFGQLPVDISQKMTNQMWNCSNLPGMIEVMRNYSGGISKEDSGCYMQAFAAPLSWATLTTQDKNSMDSNDYRKLMWAVTPMAGLMPFLKTKLLMNVDIPKLKNMMDMLKSMYDRIPPGQRTRVAEWAKDQITQNYFNCSIKPWVYATLKHVDICSPSLEWLNLEALTILGPYLSYLPPSDVNYSSKVELCKFFSSAKFKTTMNPTLSKKLLHRIQECFSSQEFPEHVEKLGPLACYYDPPELNANFSGKLLSQLDQCDSSQIKGLKTRLLSSLRSLSSPAQIIRDLSSTVTALSAKEIAAIPATSLTQALKNLGPNIRWTRSQLHALIEKHLGEKKCKQISGMELMKLQPVAEGLPNCILKQVKAVEVLNEPEGLKNISKRLSRGQLMAMLVGMLKEMHPPALVPKLSSQLLNVVSINILADANVTSLDQVTNKTWTRSQAAYLAKKMADLKQLQFRKMRSVLQGITCKMINEAPDSGVMEMALAMAESPEWLSKVQAGCAAKKLFATLVKKRADYFKTITEQELDKIPSALLLHLLPSDVDDLPSSVCPIFLDKMEEANISSLPLNSPSRPALTKKALFCLTNGTDLSSLTGGDLPKLGPLVCELQPSQLRLMNPDVLNSAFQEMASCKHIPQQYRADIIKMVHQTFGNSSDWTEDTVESVGPLLLCDKVATSALPNKPWMKDVFRYIKSLSSDPSDALKKKIFALTTTRSNATRKKREILREPTENLIQELGMDNVYWSAGELDKMSNSTFLATVEILGEIPNYSADQLAVLSKKATEAFGPVSQMNEGVVIQLECINQGFSNSDLENLPLPMDIVEGISRCGWTQSQMESLWRGIAKYNNLKAQQLGAAEMVSLNRLICGLSSSEIKQLNISAFKRAVGSMDGIKCSFQILQQLKTLAVAAFGKPSTWTEPQVADLGNILAGLDASELASLDPSVFPFVSRTCIPLIPPNNFAVLSAAQLEALGPDNAAMVTTEQRNLLNNDQLDTVETALTGFRNQAQRAVQSGAPSLGAEGLSAFMKPLLLLLIGFLLL
ncbi:stereocilin isoform X4 [Astatotilapia calliptera]|uniref:stereocilin isoform X4 n=1 Tax=Astatotilapia calliptera TaxID=8154 RepID=UPI000E3F9BBA|nr:RIIa domain-containing protein 1 isoform X4 [Astatotilapia calliptera]